MSLRYVGTIRRYVGLAADGHEALAAERRALCPIRNTYFSHKPFRDKRYGHGDGTIGGEVRVLGARVNEVIVDARNAFLLALRKGSASGHFGVCWGFLGTC